MTAKARIDPTFPKRDPGLPPKWQTALTLLVMALGVLAVYFPLQTNPGDNTMMGADFDSLHIRRMEFAESALFGPHPHLPGWYPRELLGTPFWSNIQNFPLLPTRLVLLLIDPLSAYAVGVILAAELAALFMFIFGRTIGLSRIAAAATGWTFACSGFFAARVMCGHLPLLEVYCALPLLLWLVHRCLVAPPGRSQSNALRILGVVTTLICFAGHPQIPAYAITAAAIYAIWMNFRRSRRAQPIAGASQASGASPDTGLGVPRPAIPGLSIGTLRILAVMALGVGVAAFVLYPMLLLIGRSTRILPLDAPNNDIAFPVSRLLAFVLPWRDGWPPAVMRFPPKPEHFSNVSIFWETVCYIGLLPLAAAGFWLIIALVRRRLPRRPWAFITVAGIVGLLLALPAMHDLMAHLPGTLVRSPARLIYFTLFALSFALGAGIDLLLAVGRGRIGASLAVVALLLAHGLDLGSHDRCFIRTGAILDLGDTNQRIVQIVGDGRAAIDSKLLLTINRQVDDIGYFDSVALAKPYRALIDLAGKPPGWNSQYLDGSDTNMRTLETCAVRFMLTTRPIPGESPLVVANTNLYALPLPEFTKGKRAGADRVEFFPMASTVTADLPTIHEHLRDRTYDLIHRLLIPTGSPVPPTGASAASVPAVIDYTRDSEDRMTLSATVPQTGYLRINEAWDPGWHATVDGNPAPLLAGDDVFLTLPLSRGNHTIHLEFFTPGVAMGWIITIVCLSLMMWITRRQPVRSTGIPRININP